MNENQDINVNTEIQGEQETPSNTQEVQEKMLPQSKVNEVVEGRLKREREKLNKEWQEKFDALQESIKLQNMSQEERKEHDYNKKLADLEAREKALQEKETAYSKQQYLNEISAQLQAKGLPTDMAELLVDYDAETVASKIASMEQSFNTQVNASIESRIKSSANTPTVPQEQSKPITLEDINAMTPTQFKQNKAEIEKVLMEAFKK